MKIGVLALQGDFAKHLEMLHSLHIESIEVRRPAELKACDGLILPGGESTTILKQLWFIELFNAIAQFAQKKPLFGTCAGLILMSKKVLGCDRVKPMDILNIAVERNAFGRQIESFRTPVHLTFFNKPLEFPAVFIRAPRIRQCGPEVKILATHQDEPILIQDGIHLGATFHPELTENPLVHEYFIALVSQQIKEHKLAEKKHPKK
jgi:pyridoxal 5'-phosphate synthase pdxT subunit